MLASLSHRARIALRQFIAIWIKPAPQPTRLPPAIAATLNEIIDARARNDCKAIGRGQKRLCQLRNEGLRIENMRRNMRRAHQFEREIAR